MHLLFFLFCFVIPFLPTIVAALRHSEHLLAIFLINFFLGWTVIGWIVALIWAATSQPKYGYAYAYPYTPRRFY